MCAILGWAGDMPIGLLTQLFTAAEERGKDSTGIAYRKPDTNKNFIIKQAVPARLFVKINSDYLKEARSSEIGICHTRRASPRMPVDNTNAHPYIYQSTVFAHNGHIKNWQALREKLVQEAAPTEKYKIDYLKDITTDSMVLGPYIEKLNFEPVEGSLGLVWLYGNRAYCMHSKKELTSANILWTDNEDESVTHVLTVVASTWDIIEKALNHVKGIKYDAQEKILEENVLYVITPEGPVNEGAVVVNEKNEIDKHSSKVD